MQQPNSFRLVIRRGPQPNQTYEISKDVTTLGRDITNDIVINDRETSRHHLRLQRSTDTVTVEDLGSTNGTFVNGKRVSGLTTLQNGDMLGLGETVTLAFEIQRGQQPAAAPEPSLPSAGPLSPPPLEAPAADAAYGPPAAAFAGQPPVADPYMPPLGEAAPAPPNAYAEQPQMQQPGFYAQQTAGYQIPPPPQQYPGYDYDPYRARDDEGGSSQWLVLGCFVFIVLAFVCFGFIGLLLIDTLNLWCETPVITQIVSAFGYC